MELIAKTPVVESSSRPADAASGARFHLIPEAVPAGGPPAPLEVPDLVSGLHLGAGGWPSLVAGDAAREALRLEPVQRDGQPRLLLLNLGGPPVWHNDRVAPPAILLRDRDHLRVAGGPALEVALFNRPFIGPPPADLVGKLCPICRTVLSAESRVYVCPVCHIGLHHELGDENSALQCARVASACCGCGHPIQLRDGYLSPPQFLTEGQSPES